MDGTLRDAFVRVPHHIATGVLTLIERLSLEDGLSHLDLLPYNVIMTADGPRLIDWFNTVRAPAALDLAVCHIVLSELVPELVDDPGRPRAYGAAMQSEYARLAGMSQAALTAAMEPYLPRTFAALWPPFSPAQRERLLQRVEATLRSEA
jgi:Ser/Thr protein kinase RdoA (MazF antagonist)